jgi:hypothetical protein
MMTPPLRYCVLIDRPELFAWEQQCIAKLDESQLAEIALIVRQPASSSEEAEAWRLVCELAGEIETHVPTIALADLQAKAPHVLVEGEALDARAIAALTAQPLDFVLVFGNPQARFDIGTFARGGAWAFVVNDPATLESPLPCFWEMFNDEAVTGAALLKLVNTSTPGIPLRRGYFPVVHDSLRQSMEAVFPFFADWPVDACRAWLEEGDAALDGAPLPQPMRSRGLPSGNEIRHFRALADRARRAVTRERLYCLVDWNIGRLSSPIQAFIGRNERAKVEILQPSRKRTYIADPCVVTVNHQQFIFCEEYPYDSGLGLISVFELGKARLEPLPIIREPFHLSYPQVFEYNGHMYCVPESGSANCVRLYRAVLFPTQWVLDRTLIENFSAVDSTLLRQRGEWWLFCTSAARGRRAYNSHLYIWHAPDLFGPWSPHPRNPVKIDVRSVRPAGQIFEHDGAWYRPAQDCSRRYGGAITLNRIDRLDLHGYEETVVGTIRPPAGAYDKGIHTISSSNGETIVDVQRTVFEPRSLITAAWQMLRGAARGAGVSDETLSRFKQRLRGTKSG